MSTVANAIADCIDKGTEVRFASAPQKSVRIALLEESPPEPGGWRREVAVTITLAAMRGVDGAETLAGALARLCERMPQA